MKWFKHDSDASSDAKVKKLLIKHGAIGYAIYFHCIELIAGDISETNLTFELEHDSEIIADNLKINGTSDKSGIDIVEEVMRYIIELGLFQSSNDKIFCFKLLKRLDTSMTSNTKFRAMINQAKESHDLVMTGSCKKRIEENRKEEKNEDFELFWDIYPKKVGKRISKTKYESLRKSGALPDISTLTAILESWKQTEQWKKDEGKYIPNPSTWLNQGRWEDELPKEKKGLTSGLTAPTMEFDERTAKLLGLN